MRERLFAPLGMKTAGFGPLGEAALARADAPFAHHTAVDTFTPVVSDNPPLYGPAGTVHCSMRDWMRFITLHLDAARGHPALLSAASFEKLHMPYPGQPYTLGAWVKLDRSWADGPVYMHAGSNSMNYAVVWWAPRKNAAFAAVANVGPGAATGACDKAIAGLLRRAALI